MDFTSILGNPATVHAVSMCILYGTVVTVQGGPQHNCYMVFLYSVLAFKVFSSSKPHSHIHTQAFYRNPVAINHTFTHSYSYSDGSIGGSS